MVLRIVDVLVEATSVVITLVTSLFEVTVASTVVVAATAEAGVLVASCRGPSRRFFRLTGCSAYRTSSNASTTSGEAGPPSSAAAPGVPVGMDRLAAPRLVVTVTYCQFAVV